MADEYHFDWTRSASVWMEETLAAEQNDIGHGEGAAPAALSTTHLMERVRDDAGALQRWLFDAALPLWWSNGADHANGGFEELLDKEGSPVAAPRRARVQARQVYVYATAGALGWGGPWRNAMNHGLDYFITHYLRPDDLVRPTVSPMGEPSEDDPVLYDQAFGLLALAAAQTASTGVAKTGDRARALIAAIEFRFGFDSSGYRSGDSVRPFQSNPHMHLFEAFLAWMACDPSQVWSDLASRIANLAMTRFVDDTTGALREFFDEQWAPAPGVDGTIVEPGHQFEWAWLLFRWGRLSGDPAAIAAANRLFEIGAGPGVDCARNVAVNALDDGFRVLDASARLWPQTERIKAALLAAELNPAQRDKYLTQAIDGIAGLKPYLRPTGTWRDRMTVEGFLVEEPAPASSLYHIVGAIAEVARAAIPVLDRTEMVSRV